MSPSSSWTVERARIAGMSSRPNRPPDDPDLLAAKRNLKFLRLLEHIEKVLATDPPLSDEQREQLAAAVRVKH